VIFLTVQDPGSPFWPKAAGILESHQGESRQGENFGWNRSGSLLCGSRWQG